MKTFIFDFFVFIFDFVLMNLIEFGLFKTDSF